MWQSTAIWGQLLERKKEQLGECAWRDANVCSTLLAHGGMVPSNEAILEAVLKSARTTKHPWLTASDANMNPEDFGPKQ